MWYYYTQLKVWTGLSRLAKSVVAGNDLPCLIKLGERGREGERGGERGCGCRRTKSLLLCSYLI